MLDFLKILAPIQKICLCEKYHGNVPIYVPKSTSPNPQLRQLDPVQEVTIMRPSMILEFESVTGASLPDVLVIGPLKDAKPLKIHLPIKKRSICEAQGPMIPDLMTSATRHFEFDLFQNSQNAFREKM